MTTPGPVSSASARNAANVLPSLASSVRSACETAAPERGGIGGAESSSKHTLREPKGAGQPMAYLADVTDESHRDAMNDAIRAQRERGNVPKSTRPPEDEAAPVPAAPEPMAPEPEPTPRPAPEPVAKRGFLARLLGR